MQTPPYQRPQGSFQPPSGPYQQPSQPYQQPSQQRYAPGQPGTGWPMPSVSQKDRQTTLLLCLFLGGVGGHRFYTGHTGIGVVQLLTLGGCGIWALYDLLMIVTDKFKDAKGLPLLKK